MEHLHVVFDALHDEDMQWQVPVCMLLNECFPFLSFPVMCLQKTTMWKVGAFYLIFLRSCFSLLFSVFLPSALCYISAHSIQYGKLHFFTHKGMQVY